jgi:hypothetical protein
MFKKVSVIRNYTGAVNRFSGVILVIAAGIIYLKIFGIM